MVSVSWSRVPYGGEVERDLELGTARRGDLSSRFVSAALEVAPEREVRYARGGTRSPSIAEAARFIAGPLSRHAERSRDS